MASLTIADIHTSPVATVSPDLPVHAALNEMKSKQISALVVVDEGKPVGIYTERDAVLIAHSRSSTDDIVVGDVMGYPLLTVAPDMDYRDAFQLSQEKRVRHLVVVGENQELQGIVTETDFLDHLGVEYLVNFKEVGAVMIPNVHALNRQSNIEEAVQLMAHKQLSCIVVVENEKPIGMLTERDLVRLAWEEVDLKRTLLEEVMSSPVHTVSPTYELIEAIAVMDREQIRRLVAVDDDGAVVGLVTRHDVVKVLYNRHIEYLKGTIDRLKEELSMEPDRLYHHLLEYSGDAIVVARAYDGRLTEVNTKATQMLAQSKDQLMKWRMFELFSDISEQDWSKKVLLCKEGNLPVFQTQFGIDQQQLVPVEVSLSCVEGSSLNYVVAVVRDISARLASDEELIRNQEHLRLSATVFENTAEGVVITDADIAILDVNRAFTDITGYEREEVLGKDPTMFKSGRHDESFYQDLWRSVEETGQWRGEIWNRRKDGSVFPEWLTISAVYSDDGVLLNYVGVFSDISSIKNSQEQLEHLAHHDALTGLPNRLLFNAHLKHAISHAKRTQTNLAVVFLDLDRFKMINDSFGHTVGDELLKQVADMLVNTLRVDDTVARIGGDEYVLLLEDIDDPEYAAIAADKVIRALGYPFKLGSHDVHITASMGISIYPRDGESINELLRNADAAMYRAKEAGRNTYQFYTSELTQHAFEHVLLENSLRRAIEKDEFLLLYQPQIDLRSGRVVGVEALIRWNHPDLGIISPIRFTPVAEESDLIERIGEWVLINACYQAASWLQDGIEFGRVAVNVASRQLYRSGIVDTVSAALKASGLPAEKLELEVTENLLMQETSRVIVQLEALRDLGITLAIDDFGTGYSSLSYLKSLPISKLKIDKSFVRDLPHDPDDMAISNAVIALGNSMQMTVIAEGVENEAQARFLEQAGCPEVQGFLYSQPITADELVSFLQGFPDSFHTVSGDSSI